MTGDVWRLSASNLADRVRSGELSAKEVLEAQVERIEAHNEELRAFVHTDFDDARAQAAEIDRRLTAGEEAGPLAGVPLGVKDTEDVAGMPTTHGSPLYADHVASEDATTVARLRAAGCVIIGKTAAPDFGAAYTTSTKLHGTTRNPWNLERTPGGSSGGSASAVAAGLVPLATASDGGGSTRIPASYTGLPGFKGTFGRVPKGASPEGSLTTVRGTLARTIGDLARSLDCLVGAHERDQFSLPHPGFRYEERLSHAPRDLRATWSSDLGFAICSAEVERIARRAADSFAESGAFGWAQVPVELEDPAIAWAVLNAPETWHKIRPHWPDRKGDLPRGMRERYEEAPERFRLDIATDAIEVRWRNNQSLAEVFSQVDLIVTPTTATTAIGARGPAPEQIEGRDVHPMMPIAFCYPFNFSGHPAISLPCGLDSEGMPVGLQLVTRRHDDHVLLALGARYEKHFPWPELAPAYGA